MHSTSPVKVLFPINISKLDMYVIKLHSEDEEYNKSVANPVT